MPCWRSVRLFWPWQRLLGGRLCRQSHRFWARLAWSSCGGIAGRDVSVSSYPHLPRHLISLLGSCPCPPSTHNANANTKKDVVERNGKGDANGNAHRNSRIRCWKGHVQSFDVGAYVTPWEGHSVRPAHVPPEYR